MIRRFTLRSRTEAMRKRERRVNTNRVVHLQESRPMPFVFPKEIKREEHTLFAKYEGEKGWQRIDHDTHDELALHGVVPAITIIDPGLRKIARGTYILHQVTSPSWLLWEDIENNSPELEAFLQTIAHKKFRNRVAYALQEQLKKHNARTNDTMLTILR